MLNHLNAVLMSKVLAIPVATAGGAEMVTKILNMTRVGVTALGVGILIFGAVRLGLSLKDGQGNGDSNASSVGMILGGALIVGAAQLFSQIDIAGLFG